MTAKEVRDLNRNTAKIGVLASLLLIGLLAIPALPTAHSQEPSEQSVDYPSVKDAHVYQASPDLNFNETSLAVRSSTGANKRTYVAFDLSAIPPANILSASLRLYVYQAPVAPRKYEASVVWSTWNEDGVTWNQQPSWGSRLSGVTVPNTPGWLEFPVTEAVKAHVNRWWTVEGFIIRDESEDSASSLESLIASREYSNETLRPVLRVRLSFQPDFSLQVWPDWQTVTTGTSVSYWAEVRSINSYEGPIMISANTTSEILAPLLSVAVEPSSFSLRANEVRGGISITVGLLGDVPAGSYRLTVNAASGELAHTYNLTLDVRQVVVSRDLPASVRDISTPFTVTIRYQTGIINATGLIINEYLDRNLVLVDWTGPSGSTVANVTSTRDWGTQLKWVIMSSTPFEGFTINYTVLINYTGPPENMPRDFWFNGDSTAVDIDGQKHPNPTLGDNRVSIERGLPGPWDDDSRVDDWELLEVIAAWVDGRLGTTTEENDSSLLAYIQMWVQTYQAGW